MFPGAVMSKDESKIIQFFSTFFISNDLDRDACVVLHILLRYTAVFYIVEFIAKATKYLVFFVIQHNL